MDEKYNVIEFWNGSYAAAEAYNSDESTGCEYLDSQLKALAESGRVLDFGCGLGWASLYLGRFGCPETVGLDAAENGVNICRKSAELSGLSDRVGFICGTQAALAGLPAQSFDGAFSSNTLDVVEQEVCFDMTAQIARVLKPGASFIVMLNAYLDEERIAVMKLEPLREKHYAMNGVLRCVNRDIQEWQALFAPYFDCVQTGTFHFEGEPEWYQRRLLKLVRKQKAEEKR